MTLTKFCRCVSRYGRIALRVQKKGEDMEKLQATIMTILDQLERPLYRTEIVKSVYMIDEMYYRHFGKTITGLQYIWDNYGPNAKEDAIVNEAEKMFNSDIVHISPEPNQYGDTSYLYTLKKRDERLLNSLTDIEKYVINDILCHYKTYDLKQLIEASKKTESFKGTKKQGDDIKLKQSDEYKQLTESLIADKDFMVDVEAAVKEAGA